MGCSTSKNAVSAFERSNSLKPKSATNSIPEKNNGENMDTATDNNTSYLKYRPAEAFVVSLEEKVNTDQSENTIESTDDGLTKVKPPPKRLQRLMEQAQIKADNPTNTIDDLEGKLARAEQRRQEYLQQKVNSIPKVNQVSPENQSQGIDPLNNIPNKLPSLEEKNF